MAPDINTLPPPRSGSIDEGATEASPRAPSVSLAAAATINAGMQSQESRRSSTSSSSRSRAAPPAHHERQRSAVMMNLSMNDPALPGPGELQAGDLRATTSSHRTGSGSPHSHGGSPFLPGTADPHHQRAPSLGELHQELEQEQEAQVNRLLLMIRQQQEQLQQLQQGQGQGSSDPTGAAAIDDSTPTSERSLSFPSVNQTPASITNPRPRSPVTHGRRGSYGLSRRSSSRSRTHSRGTPPPSGLSGSGEGPEAPWNSFASSRDESVFHQAESQMLTRENQMLKQRIRELERQLSESSSPSATSTSPVVGSQFNTSPLAQAEASAPPVDAPSEEAKGPDI